MSMQLGIYRMSADASEPIASVNLSNKNFAYKESYLKNDAATPLSLSLPLKPSPFDEPAFRPYLEGLLPEGRAREELCEQLKLRYEDYLGILGACGSDCIGDVVIVNEGEAGAAALTIKAEQEEGSHYRPIDADELGAILARPSQTVGFNAGTRLSLAGTLHKIGLARKNEASGPEGWLRPCGGAPSTHILKVEAWRGMAANEVISLTCASACGLPTAPTTALAFDLGVTCSKRFDRTASLDTDGNLHVERLHQEDLAQALGVLPREKYLELEPSTAACLSKLIVDNSARPLHDMETLLLTICFNYAIGNCDNHLKNLSFLHPVGKKKAVLSPVYDIVCTTIYENLSREMGMKIGTTRIIDEVEPDDFILLAQELGIGMGALRRACQAIIEPFTSALRQAGANTEPIFSLAPYIADDIEEDAIARIRVLEAVVAST